MTRQHRSSASFPRPNVGLWANLESVLLLRFTQKGMKSLQMILLAITALCHGVIVTGPPNENSEEPRCFQGNMRSLHSTASFTKMTLFGHLGSHFFAVLLRYVTWQRKSARTQGLREQENNQIERPEICILPCFGGSINILKARHIKLTVMDV